MYICKDSVFDPVCDLCRYCIHGRMSLINLANVCQADF